MEKAIKFIPNLFTLGNVLCGCVGIVEIFKGNLVMASYLVAIAAVLDFADGFVARALNAQSEFGKQLDSLADACTFGILPAMLAFSLLNQSLGCCWYSVDWLPYLAFLIALFSVMRLAKFNIDTRQSESFIGVPTPANAILWASFPLILKYHREYTGYVLSQPILIFLVILMSGLLVAEIPLFALKFKTFGWKNNEIKFTFLIISILLLIFLQYLAIPLIIFLYVVMSLIAPKPSSITQGT